MRSNQTVVDTQAINTSSGSTITVAADKTLVVNNLSGNGSDIVVTDTFNMSGESVLCNLVMTNYLSSLSDDIVANANIQIANTKNLQTDTIKSTTTNGTITVSDHLKINTAKTLYASTIQNSGGDPTDFVDVTYKLKTPWLRTDLIDPLTGGTPIDIAGSAAVAEGHTLSVNTINPTTGDFISTADISASNLTLKANGSLTVDYSDDQSIILLSPTTLTSLTGATSPLVYDPSDNKIKCTAYTTDPNAVKTLTEYWTQNRLELVPYTTITEPLLPAELIALIKFLVPSDFAFVTDVIPGFSPTEETTYQNGYIYADSGVWKVRSSDLQQLVATTTVPKDKDSGGLVLTIPDDQAYDIHFSIFKPFYMQSDSTSGFRFECNFAIVNATYGKTVVALVSSTDSSTTNPYLCNGADPLAYFHDSVFLVFEPEVTGANLRFYINKQLSTTSHSQQGFNTGIPVTAGRMIKFVLNWNPLLGKIRYTITHGVLTYDSDAYLSAGDCPGAYQYAPFISQTRKASTNNGIWLNKLICQQYYV